VTLGRPDRIPVAKLANDALGAFAALVVAGLSARIFRRRGLAIATGFVAALCPTQVFIALDIQSEPLFVALLLCAGYLFLAATDRPSSNLAVAAGAFLAAAALTRSSALALPPLLLGALWDRRYPFRARAHIVLSALLGFGAVLLPWTVRNALVFHELILVNDGAGCVFYGRNADIALSAANANSREELERAGLRIQESLQDRIAGLPGDVRDSPGKLSRALTGAALDERRANPAGTARLLAWKALTWLRPYPDPRFWPRRAVVGVGGYVVTLFLLACVGLARAERRGVSRFCLILLGVTMLVHVVLEANWRYRTTYWDPVLLLYASYGAATLLAHDRKSPAAAA
jgi:4-amino-4-deoxy-L-arabinose transferase-like glycosyltransferase